MKNSASVLQQIKGYIAEQPEPKRSDLQALHELLLKLLPGSRLWFLDGRDEQGKIVTNPNIGYGLFQIQYAQGTSKDFYQVGLSANTTGISVYIMGIKDKNHLAASWGSRIGKAKVTGYCIRFKALKDIHMDVLEEALRYGIMESGG